MADDPLKTPNSGAIGMPQISSGMNKVSPANVGGGKGAKNDKEATRLGAGQPETEKLLERARKRMDRAIAAEGDNRKSALDDDKFYTGDQWPSDTLAQRNFDQRPALTVNKLPTFVLQVTNDVRQNRPSINVSPVGDKSDPEVAKMYAGMIREIERKSVADIAYDTAFASAARGGWGYWRVITEYEKPNSLHQVATIKRIRNRFTVYMDPAIQEPEGADAKYCFISEMISRDEFKEDYPDADPMPWREGGIGDSLKTWITKDEIRIAEYFEIETEKRNYVLLENGIEGWEDEISQENLDRFKIIAKAEKDWAEVWWYKLTAVEVLEKKKWPGKWIPVVRVIGDEVDIEGKVKLWGIVRHAKDPQRMYNYLSTAEVEVAALAPKAPYIMAEGQEEGHEMSWKNANVRSYPYLLYKPTDLNGNMIPPPQRQPTGQVPAGIEQARQNAAQDMMATTGIRFDSTTKDQMYDESGRALRELRRTGDLGSFHLVDNLARALRHTGEILVDIIPKIYDRKRVTTILREDDEEERITVDPSAPKAMQEVPNQQTGKVDKIFNPTIGEYGVTVTIGPSYATKRIEAAESMMDFVRAMPQAGAIIMDLVAKNQDWPGADQMAARLAKAIPPNLLAPDMKDVPPQIQAVLAAQQKQLQEAQQQIVTLTKAVTERDSDRAIQQQKNEQDFEAKLLAIAQKQENSINTHIASQLKEVVSAVSMLHDAIRNPQPAQQQ